MFTKWLKLNDKKFVKIGGFHFISKVCKNVVTKNYKYLFNIFYVKIIEIPSNNQEKKIFIQRNANISPRTSKICRVALKNNKKLIIYRMVMVMGSLETVDIKNATFLL